MARSNNYEKNKHLIGTQIYEWTILDIVIYDDKQHTYTLAKCRCGTIKEVRLSYIINNKIKDCGCGHRNRLKESTRKKYEHLINTKINGWTILNIIPPDEKQHHTFAICQCKCGTIKKVRLSYITNERSKDCGCGRKKMLRETRTKNLVGQRFGRLTVVKLLEDSNKFKRRLYRCKCDCGGEITTSSICLTERHTSSCGCLLSYWNMYIEQFLKESGVEHITEYPIFYGNRLYRFDFYLPDYNLFIEYDGKQHYEPVKFYTQDEEEAERNLKKRQEYDRIKNRYCEENNINLLRIPYWETKNIKIIINSCLQRLSEKGFVEQSTKYATV